ncbi:hypothetical protein GEM_4357 [Burkholderia cepacia GG4]|uniref:Uncharacterized protein n=1 Tax=Burkholderia cepacia GG4 TaxID=1009846 RepID=A0A9W3K4E7_BURCE|nr:hypothetical protein GEM_4357 [Burkholderia cepacia GG4]
MRDRSWLPRFTPPRRIADIHDTHVSENEIVKTFQFVWGKSDGSSPANAGRGKMPAHRAGDIQRDAGCAIRAFTASTSAFIRARIAAFEPTSASDDAMIR